MSIRVQLDLRDRNGACIPSCGAHRDVSTGAFEVLAFEAGCNVGKSYAVHRELIRPMLMADPGMPMLHFSVRITHANDLYQTCIEHYVDNAGQPIQGMKLELYREGIGGKKERCRNAHQLVISPQSAADPEVLGDVQSLERFKGGVLVRVVTTLCY